MTIQAWTDLSILVGPSELAGHGKNVTLAVECAPLDKTNFQSAGYVELTGGSKSGTLSLDFMQDMAAAGPDDSLWDLLGDSGVPKSLCTPSADGSVAYLCAGVPVTYKPIDGPAGELAMAAVSLKSSGVIARGRLLHPGATARTSSSTGTGRQLGAVAAGKSLYAALHVVEVSGSTPSLTVKVQSDDNSGFTSATDRITFTAATARTFQWSSVAGAITDDYWRITYTISGTGPSFKFAVTAGIV